MKTDTLPTAAPAAAGKKHPKRSGAQVLIDCLLMHGVKHIFGYPGGANIPIYDVLYATPKIKHILVRHEQGASHMADAYYRVSGKIGVCLATSGPGATNLVTGICTAMMDSIPMIVLTGQVPSHLIGNDAFQEADVTGITRPITKHNYLVKDVNDLARVIHEAFHIATTGRPGPVLIDIPKDISKTIYDGPIDVPVDLPGYRTSRPPSRTQIEKAAELVNNAERPLFYVGGGAVIAGAWREIRDAAKRSGTPVTTTLMALGVYPSDDPLCLQMLGMHGTAAANFAVTNCDVLVAIGARFDDRVTGKLSAFSPRSKKVHFDIDPSCINKNITVEVPVVGDCREAMKIFAKLLKPKERPDWYEMIDIWKKRHPMEYPKNRMCAQHVISEIHRITEGDAVVTTDVGQHQMWTAQFYGFKQPRNWVTSGGLGTMGFGLPAAIGAQMVRPKDKVWSINGDGGILMNIQEMVTAKIQKLPIKVVVINNGFLGMVRQWQEFFENRHYSEVDLTGNPDFVEVAKAFGWEGRRVTKLEEVPAAIEWAQKYDKGPVLLDFIVEREDNVYPMVPAGGANDEMIFFPKDPVLV
ncbi:MAG: biosynthetic-type acetolactate synthase large subunit [Planctomycetota bacterium]